MVGQVVGGTALASVAIAALIRYVRPAALIWRGDASRVPASYQSVVTVTPRTYPSFLLCVGALTIGIALAGMAVALGGITGADWPKQLLLAGLILPLANVVLVPLNWFVEATGRPKLLVPPPHRDQPSSLAAARTRRGRKRAGLPPTEHLVEIVQVLPGDYEAAFLVAICADGECGWMEFGDADTLSQSENQLRATASRHTTNVARDVQHRP